MRTRLSDALVLIRTALLSCGSHPGLEHVLAILEEAYEGVVPLDERVLEYVIGTLDETARMFKVRGCLDYYLLEQAKDVLESL